MHDEQLNEDAGASLVLLTTILVGLPIGSKVAAALSGVIDTIMQLRNDRKVSEAKTLTSQTLSKYKSLLSNKTPLTEDANVTSGVSVDQPTGQCPYDEDEDSIKSRVKKVFLSEMENVPRAKMPQISDLSALAADLVSHGYDFHLREEPPDLLIPTQSDVDYDETRVNPSDTSLANKYIVTSADGCIIDGHHRWKAAIENERSIHTFCVEMPQEELLQFLQGKDYVTYN